MTMARLTLALLALAPLSAAWISRSDKHKPRMFRIKRGGFVGGRVGASEGSEELAAQAFDWCANLGAPAALVAGAVLETLQESGELLQTKAADSQQTRLFKRGAHLLLISSFALNIVSIFATTVTGTVLMSLGDRNVEEAGIETYSAMGYLKANHEFEYLMARVTFLQGLLNWLGGIALTYLIPRPGQGAATRKMHKFIAASFGTLLLFIVAFYNNHMNFFANYSDMLVAFFKSGFERFFLCSPPRPMALLFVPASLLTLKFLFDAVVSEADDEEPHGKRRV